MLAESETGFDLDLSGDIAPSGVPDPDVGSADVTDCEDIAGSVRYIREIGRFSFLSREEEIGLSRRVLAGQIAECRLANSDCVSEIELRALRSCVSAARSEAARLGIWSGIADERPIAWSESEQFAEDVRLANLIQSGQIARFSLTGGKGLSAVRKAELLAEIDTARKASESLGLAWSAYDSALAQLNRLPIDAEEKLRTDILLTSAATAAQRLTRMPPSSQHEVEQLVQARGDARLARDVLVERNLRLVVSLARKYCGHGLDVDDLTGYGNVGLIESAEKYDWRRGTRFSTYASLGIRQHILRAISDTGRTIRIPSYRVDDTRRINRAIPDLAQSLGHSPTTSEIAAEVGLDDDEVRRLIDLSQPAASLDRPISDEDAETTYATTLADPTVDVETDISNSDLRGKLKTFFLRAGLNQREVTILHQRLADERSYDSIAAEHSLPRERVRQMVSEIRRPIIAVASPLELDQYLSPAYVRQFSARRADF